MRTALRYVAAALVCAVAIAGACAAPADGRTAPAEASPALKAILERLQRHYQKTESFSAKFKEKITTAGGANRDREGTVVYHKPGRMRWEFKEPQAETIVSDGTTLYSYEPDLNQVIETSVGRAFKSSAPAALLLGIGSIERDFSASLPDSPPADKLVHLSLKPKQGGSEVALGLDRASYDVVTLTVTDELGNTTAFEFSDIRTNAPLEDGLFHFKVPPGADIVTAPATAPDAR
ncbi:MAG: outer membrane lipoprotein carrier protein LolA [Candidatus Binataceae bacterium]